MSILRSAFTGFLWYNRQSHINLYTYIKYTYSVPTLWLLWCKLHHIRPSMHICKKQTNDCRHNNTWPPCHHSTIEHSASVQWLSGEVVLVISFVSTGIPILYTYIVDKYTWILLSSSTIQTNGLWHITRLIKIQA